VLVVARGLDVGVVGSTLVVLAEDVIVDVLEEVADTDVVRVDGRIYGIEGVAPPLGGESPFGEEIRSCGVGCRSTDPKVAYFNPVSVEGRGVRLVPAVDA